MWRKISLRTVCSFNEASSLRSLVSFSLISDNDDTTSGIAGKLNWDGFVDWKGWVQWLVMILMTTFIYSFQFVSRISGLSKLNVKALETLMQFKTDETMKTSVKCLKNWWNNNLFVCLLRKHFALTIKRFFIAFLLIALTFIEPFEIN